MKNSTATEPNLSEPVRNVDAVQIFASGNYGAKGSFSDDDLKTIAGSYSPDTHEAPVTIDHKQSGPAFGWVKRVYSEGSKLFADLANVPESFADAISKGRWSKRSAEIYRAFGETQTPYLAAVTFLGAKRPHVKGMDVVTLSEFGEFDSIEWAVESFGELSLPKPPDGLTVGVLTQSAIASPLADNHFHDVFLDADGNGYTGPPTCYAHDYREQQAEDDDGYHIHTVANFEIEATGDPAHIHRMTIPYSDDEETIMPEEPKVEPIAEPATPAEPAAPVAENFSESDEAKALRAENKELQDRMASIEVERFSEKQEAAFDAAVSTDIEPAQRNKMKAVFMALPRDAAPITFAEGETPEPLGKALLACFSEFPTRKGLDEVVGKPATHEKTIFSESDNDAKVAARAHEIVKDQGIDLAKAQVIAFNELS